MHYSTNSKQIEISRYSTCLVLRGYLLSNQGASLVVPMVKNLSAMQETQVQSLGREDPPGEGHGNPLQYSCLENPMDSGAWRASRGRKESMQSQRAGHSWSDWACMWTDNMSALKELFYTVDPSVTLFGENMLWFLLLHLIIVMYKLSSKNLIL